MLRDAECARHSILLNLPYENVYQRLATHLSRLPHTSGDDRIHVHVEARALGSKKTKTQWGSGTDGSTLLASLRASKRGAILVVHEGRALQKSMPVRFSEQTKYGAA